MDTSETGLEKIIACWLVKENGYEQETPHAYNKDFALVDKWVERFVTEMQPEKVKQSMCFASPSERLKFFTRLSNEITKLNDDIINIIASMLEEKTEFVQTYFANPDFQKFVNARVFQAAVSRLSSERL